MGAGPYTLSSMGVGSGGQEAVAPPGFLNMVQIVDRDFSAFFAIFWPFLTIFFALFFPLAPWKTQIVLFFDIFANFRSFFVTPPPGKFSADALAL